MFLNLFLKLVEKYYDHNQNISLNHERCIHSVKGCECLKCIATCSYNGIEYCDEKLSVNEDCKGCGNCIEVCPTGAITDPLQTGPLMVLGDSQEKVELFCDRDERVYGIKAKCIFNILPHQLIELHARTGKEISLITGNCEDCNKFSQIELVQKKLQLESRIKSLPATISDYGIKYDEIGVSREDFFKILQENSRKRIAAATKKVKGNNLKHVLLSEALKKISKSNFSKLIEGREFTECCRLCGKCARLCPTSSITLTEKAGEVSLSYDYLECANCGKCIAHCQHKGLIGVKGTLYNQKELAGKICSVCGQVGNDHICGKCKDKRKV